MRAKQQEIINALKVKPEIDPNEEIRRSVEFLKSYLKKISIFKVTCLRDLWWSRFYASR